MNEKNKDPHTHITVDIERTDTREDAAEKAFRKNRTREGMWGCCCLLCAVVAAIAATCGWYTLTTIATVVAFASVLPIVWFGVQAIWKSPARWTPTDDL